VCTVAASIIGPISRLRLEFVSNFRPLIILVQFKTQCCTHQICHAIKDATHRRTSISGATSSGKKCLSGTISMLFDLTFPCYLTTSSGKKCLSGKVICVFFVPLIEVLLYLYTRVASRVAHPRRAGGVGKSSPGSGAKSGPPCQ
jgi:hypothetical protein